MEFKERAVGDVDVLMPHGAIDATCSSEFRDQVALMVERGSRRIVIEMSEVNFIDSSGLGMLVSGLRTAKRADGQLKIAALHGNLRQLFESTRLDRLFELFTDVDKAVNSFRSP